MSQLSLRSVLRNGTVAAVSPGNDVGFMVDDVFVLRRSCPVSVPLSCLVNISLSG